MERRKKIEELLTGVIHPELQSDIVSNGVLEEVMLDNRGVTIKLNFPKSRDPFISSIKRQIKELLTSKCELSTDNIHFIIKEAAPKKVELKKATLTGQINKIIAISSGKGGVGKSTVTTNMAATMAQMGLRVGVLDADIYGPSQAKMFGVEDFTPETEVVDGVDVIIPAEAYGVKLMSIAFFIKSTDALLWRGPMVMNALKQLIHQTNWGELDYLLIDLPPGTGDVHLSIIQELSLDGAIIISTPQQVAIADAVRGIKMFESPKINIPIFGIIENMAWFTPAELPNNKYYLFGKDGATKLAEESGVVLLGQIPIIMGVMEGAESGKPATLEIEMVNNIYKKIVEQVVDNS